MIKIQRKTAEEARKEFAVLLQDADKGHTTIITHHGIAIAALVPLKGVVRAPQKPLTALAGSGKRMWGRDSARAVRRLRIEWRR